HPAFHRRRTAPKGRGQAPVTVPIWGASGADGILDCRSDARPLAAPTAVVLEGHLENGGNRRL
ncbi:MAG: hypothetical protein ACE5EX_09235, partial [Phycisphaerae bacterium]